MRSWPKLIVLYFIATLCSPSDTDKTGTSLKYDSQVTSTTSSGDDEVVQITKVHK